jgi:hypothetical protein
MKALRRMKLELSARAAGIPPSSEAGPTGPSPKGDER